MEIKWLIKAQNTVLANRILHDKTYARLREKLNKHMEKEKMTEAQKTAVATAYKMAKDPELFPYANKKSAEQNEMICKTLEAFFDIDEGEVKGFNKQTVDRLVWLSQMPSAPGEIL